MSVGPDPGRLAGLLARLVATDTQNPPGRRRGIDRAVAVLECLYARNEPLRPIEIAAAIGAPRSMARPGGRHFRISSDIGQRVPLPWTASGPLLVAHLADGDILRRPARSAPG